MRKLFTLTFVAAFVLMSSGELRSADRTVTGELIDIGCNMKSIKAGGEATSAANHAECSLLCARKGMPVGVRAADGVYWLVGKFTNENNKALLPFVNKQVKVSGAIAIVDGRKTIDVKRIDDVAGSTRPAR